MVRIQGAVAPDGSFVALSPDGRKAVAVVWHGDVARNVNVYSMIVLDLEHRMSGGQSPRSVISWEFSGDPEDQAASAFSNVTFLPDNRTISFLGRQGSASQQVYTVDSGTGDVHQLTHHPTPVLSYVVDANGRLRAFSAAAEPDATGRRMKLEDDGVFLWDSELFPPGSAASPAQSVLLGAIARQVRQYFLVEAGGPRLIFDSGQSRPPAPLDLTNPAVANAPRGTLEDEWVLKPWATLTGDPQGRRALLFPYALTSHPMSPEQYNYYANENPFYLRIAAPYGVLDLAGGGIDRLIDAPHPQFAPGNGAPVWFPDGRAVLVQSLRPEGPTLPPQWLEVQLDGRKATPLGEPAGWRPLSWAEDRPALVMTNGVNVGLLRRRSDGTWGELTQMGAPVGFNRDWRVDTNGRVVVGVKDASLSPPEIAAYDLSSKRTATLTNLNPALRRRKYGAVEAYRWQTTADPNAFGFLIKPVDYQPGRRYPLVILLDDGTLHREGEPYLLDGVSQLSGHAIQMLVADGIMVLYPRSPDITHVVETPNEGERVREYIESAVEQLDRSGMIDPQRIAISGWSRAGYYTTYMLIHSAIPFAAASTIDGGAIEYNCGRRPFTDRELERIRAPLLVEAHGIVSLSAYATLTDRLAAMHKPVEVLYFATAPHSTMLPRHRSRSLGTHIDWWRFWLEGKEDSTADKAAQFTHWRELRSLHEADSKGIRKTEAGDGCLPADGQ